MYLAVIEHQQVDTEEHNNKLQLITQSSPCLPLKRLPANPLGVIAFVTLYLKRQPKTAHLVAFAVIRHHGGAAFFPTHYTGD